MQSISPVKRDTLFDTTLYIYGVQRKQLEEIKISFVVARKDWRQFRTDLETYGLFKEFAYFDIDGQPIKWFGPVRGCILARSTASENDELLAYVEAHPAFNHFAEHAHEPQPGFNLIKGAALTSR
jgi:hypothetical protein